MLINGSDHTPINRVLSTMLIDGSDLTPIDRVLSNIVYHSLGRKLTREGRVVLLLKKELRKQILQCRKEIPVDMRAEKSKRIVDHLLQSSLYQEARFVFSFVPFGDEVNIRPVLEQAVQVGKRLAIPKTLSSPRELVLYPFEGWDQLIAGVYGILEPDPEKGTVVDPADIDLILMPGVAFDRQGGRLGYGGGYYDRFLASLPQLPPLLAPCFTEQMVEQVPTEGHDIQVDMLITDEEIMECAKSRSNKL